MLCELCGDVGRHSRLTVLINFAAGGPADIEGRIFAKYLVKHIDGAPTLVVQNMDGAGGLIGAQYLGEIAPKDGTVLGALTGTAWIYASDPERCRPTSGSNGGATRA